MYTPSYGTSVTVLRIPTIILHWYGMKKLKYPRRDTSMSSETTVRLYSTTDVRETVLVSERLFIWLLSFSLFCSSRSVRTKYYCQQHLHARKHT